MPASHFIDPFMRYLGHPYYVGLLSAAEIHGAAHQRPQVFQVITPARLRDRTFGRVRIEFISAVQASARPTATVNTPTGTMRVATPEVTLLDLVAAPQRGGGYQTSRPWPSSCSVTGGWTVRRSRLQP
ncbi:MAG: type IV toxin-antitoxin system AbiEi family antitoxin [Actinomycetes bacterium]